MHLIPFNETIYYNGSAMATYVMESILLIAFAYHPSFSNVVYLLYGHTLSPPAGEYFASYHLLVRDSTSGIFMQNDTLNQEFHCLIKCEMKVTAYLLLIQSESNLFIYPLISGHIIKTIPLFSADKTDGGGQTTNIHRCADINSNRFVYANSSNITIGQYDGTIKTYLLGYSITNILFVGLSNDQVFIVINAAQVIIIVYNCLDCVANGPATGTQININNSHRIATNLTISQTFRLNFGPTTVKSPSSPASGRIFWGVSDGTAWKFVINDTNCLLAETYAVYVGGLSASNHEYLIMFSSGDITFRTYGFATNVTEEYAVLHYSSFASWYGDFMVGQISNNSQYVAFKTTGRQWTAQQFQLVDDCADYNSTTNGLLCSCTQYDTPISCQFINNSTNSTTNTKTSPIAIIIATIGGICFVAITTIVIKKNYKKCTKGRRRTPYVYNPVELMSFEV